MWNWGSTLIRKQNQWYERQEVILVLSKSTVEEKRLKELKKVSGINVSLFFSHLIKHEKAS